MVTEKCLDTYALVEISVGNPRFTSFQEAPFVIHELTLVEFYSLLLRKYNEQTAYYWRTRLTPYTQKGNLDLLIKAVKFRLQYPARNFSFFDAASYVFARENGMLFITGDEGFRGVKGVEFIKK